MEASVPNSTILIVDDEYRNIKLLKALLVHHGYRILEAVDGKDALQKISQDPPDLILLDIMMPEMDGYAVCRALKADEKTRMIPIIMVTALTDRESRMLAAEAGTDDFLTKPVDSMELFIRVRSLLRIKRYHDELAATLNQLVEKNEKLQELEKSKETLTHMIVHDLRNPLQAIQGNLELLAMDKLLPATMLDTLRNCVNYCLAQNHMIADILTIRKMEEGGITPELSRIENPETFLQNIIEQCAVQAVNKDIHIYRETSPGVPPVWLDSHLIQRVIANLITNASRVTSSGGEIRVTLEHLQEQNRIRISVRDSGPGVPAQYQDRIFKMYEQVDLRRKGIQNGGCGLGLAFCKMAVELHHGRIWVESEGEGQGAAFRFEIPLSF
jgi:signal transduction histidine kinase